MEVNATPMLNANVTLQLPSQMVLPVQKDDAGQTVPATGFIWQKYLDYQTLEAMGVSISWATPEGVAIDREVALGLIARMAQRQAEMAASEGLQA